MSPDGHSFVSETAGAPDAVHVSVRLGGEVVVEHDVHPLDVKTARAQIRRYHNARLELLELIVRRDPAHGVPLERLGIRCGVV